MRFLTMLLFGSPEIIGQNEAVRRLLVNEGIDPKTGKPIAPSETGRPLLLAGDARA